MAKQTPEGKVKKELLKLLDQFGERCFYYMPVQNGMGQTGIPDIMAIINGVAFAFECKATPKQKPTTLQAFALQKIHKACGVAWVVDNESISLVKLLLENMDDQQFTFTPSDVEDAYNSEKLAPLYRWKEKLEVMEFNQ